jgi:hypothetical protein
LELDINLSVLRYAKYKYGVALQKSWPGFKQPYYIDADALLAAAGSSVVSQITFFDLGKRKKA